MRKTVSRILGFTIQTKDGRAMYDEAFESLDREGRISSKVMNKIVIEILKWIEENEQR